ncbi:hypothetical protein OK016_22570 [Vibrio chagasii]|nr:hypothetical protein [Vibrio chagasii]
MVLHSSIKQGTKWVLTPMMLRIGAIAVMDVMFALDSIPAHLAVTQEPFWHSCG